MMTKGVPVSKFRHYLDLVSVYSAQQCPYEGIWQDKVFVVILLMMEEIQATEKNYYFYVA